LLRWGLGIQSVYYLVTGAFPQLAMRLFVEITGPKIDLWLVRMVGLLSVVIGVSLGLALRNRRIMPETVILSIGSAAAFSGIDLYYVAAHRIGNIYLLDAALEMFVIFLVIVGSRHGIDDDALSC
jgi:uncharacterized protein YjeT (DUF2065 family)